MSGTSCICTISKHFLTFDNFIYIEIISDCLDEIFQDNDFRSASFFKRYTFNSSIKSSTTIDTISTESAVSKILISDILPCEGLDCIKVVLMIIISACVILAWVDSSWIGPTEKKIGYNVNRLFILIHFTYSTIRLGNGLLSVPSESQVATSIKDLVNCWIYFLPVFGKNGIPIFHLISLWSTKFFVVDENGNIGCRTAGIEAYMISFIDHGIIKLLFYLYHAYDKFVDPWT